jgi:putative FmdB family regulatory protein
MTYEYYCSHCGYTWERKGKRVHDSTDRCPCGQLGRRLISSKTSGKVKGYSEANGYSKQ